MMLSNLLQARKWITTAIRHLQGRMAAVATAEPKQVLADLRQLKGAKQVRSYCLQHLPRVGEGTSRVVFSLGDGRVVKVAKNPKGSAQNRTEIDTGNMFSEVVTRVTAYDETDEDAWIVSEQARRAKAVDWPNLAGVSWKTAQEYLAAEGARHQNRPYREQPEELHENELLGSVISMMATMDMPVGDMLRPSSWGVVDRGGKNQLVLVDSGITNDIGKEHYGFR